MASRRYGLDGSGSVSHPAVQCIYLSFHDLALRHRLVSIAGQYPLRSSSVYSSNLGPGILSQEVLSQTFYIGSSSSFSSGHGTFITW